MLTESANKMRISRTNCGFHLQVAESATAQINYANVFLFVCGFQKLFWTQQVRLRIPQKRLFLE